MGWLHLRSAGLTLLILLVLGACSSSESESVTAGKPTDIRAEDYRGSASFTVDQELSKIQWQGREVVSGTRHRGELSLKEGAFQIKKGRLSGGQFVVDMSSLRVLDMAQGPTQKLQNHLKSADFFAVDQFPEARFQIAAVEPTDSLQGGNAFVLGNLTIKGITKSIRIPARIGINENFVTVMTPEFTINRTEWDITYRSGVIGAAKDEMISDLITLRLRVRGNSPEYLAREKEQVLDTQ